MGHYRCVIFDLDGTLLDTSAGILAATEHIIRAFKLPPLTDAEKRAFIGPPIQASFQKRYGCSAQYAWKLADAWRTVYKDRFLFGAIPYDGVYASLGLLRANGIMTCVATNKREDYTERLLEHFHFLPLFDAVCGTDFVGKMKKEDLIWRCMQRCGMAPADCLMVGDTEGDKQGAVGAGIDFLGVTYGFGFAPENTGEGVPLVNDCKGWERFVLEAGFPGQRSSPVTE